MMDVKVSQSLDWTDRYALRLMKLQTVGQSTIGPHSIIRLQPPAMTSTTSPLPLRLI